MLKELLIENTPKYTQILPFSQTRVTYRPFVVREEKSLMISKETAGFEDLMMTIRNVINNCTTNLPNDDCKNLPFCDLEYLFIKIREKSETIKNFKVWHLKKVFVICDDNFFLKLLI